MWENEESEQLNILRHIDDYQAQSLGMDTLEGMDCSVVYLTGPSGNGYKVFLDGDHLIHAMEYKDEGQAGPVMNLTVRGDYAETAGVRFPHSAMIHHDGTLFATVTVKAVKVNQPLDDALFAEPAD